WDRSQSLRRVLVKLVVVSGNTATSRVTTTDSRGRYEFARLAAGRYKLTARKDGYVEFAYGQKAWGGASLSIDLKPGQVLESIDVGLPKGAVISGEVDDEYGDPAVNVQVAAMRSQTVNGRRRLVPSNVSATTNDLGEFRLFGLPPDS